MPLNLAILTSGGDAPGMNAAVRAFTRRGIWAGHKVYAVKAGYRGLINNEFTRLKPRDVGMVIHQGGTFIKTSRCPEFSTEEVQKNAAKILKKRKIDALCVIGGDGSFRGLDALSRFYDGRLIGIPGTIDNDIPGTDYSIGFDTAVHTAVSAIDKIRDTASSHNRTVFVEVMGRNSGQIALSVAIACGAEDVLIPEETTNIEVFCRRLQENRKAGKKMGIIVVAEGDDAGGAFKIAEDVREKTGIEIKVSILGYIQRGGPPTAYERVWASRMGEAAVRYIEGNYNLVFTAMKSGHIVPAYLKDATTGNRTVSPDLLKLVRMLSS